MGYSPGSRPSNLRSNRVIAQLVIFSLFLFRFFLPVPDCKMILIAKNRSTTNNVAVLLLFLTSLMISTPWHVEAAKHRRARGGINEGVTRGEIQSRRLVPITTSKSSKSKADREEQLSLELTIQPTTSNPTATEEPSEVETVETTEAEEDRSDNSTVPIDVTPDDPPTEEPIVVETPGKCGKGSVYLPSMEFLTIMMVSVGDSVVETVSATIDGQEEIQDRGFDDLGSSGLKPGYIILIALAVLVTGGMI